MSLPVISPPYKNVNGQFYTRNLFYEQQYLLPMEDRVIQPVFSFLGHPDFIPFRASFVELRDPTGYKWAMKYLKSWKHWNRLVKCSWFIEHLEEAQEELKASLKSEAVTKLIQIASGDSPQALQAAKYLASAEYEKPAHGRGRPSREEKEGALKRAVRSFTTEQEDAQRIGLVIGDVQ